MEVLSTNERTLSPKDWALTIFIASLPLIGIIMLFVWGFGSEGNIHRKNWALGTLIIYIVAFIIAFTFVFFFGGLAMLSNLAGS